MASLKIKTKFILNNQCGKLCFLSLIIKKKKKSEDTIIFPGSDFHNPFDLSPYLYEAAWEESPS